MKKLIGAFILILIVIPFVRADVTFTKDTLVIETTDGRKLSFEVELALSEQQQRRGLMFRKTLSQQAGMLFVHAQEKLRFMWMKNTYIPLDMLFIANNGCIVHIHQNATPRSTESLSSRLPARAVLELNGGTTQALKINIHDKIHYRAFPLPFANNPCKP